MGCFIRFCASLDVNLFLTFVIGCRHVEVGAVHKQMGSVAGASELWPFGMGAESGCAAP